MNITDKIIELVGYLDARVDVLRGYYLSVQSFDFRPGQHDLRVQLFPESLGQAQEISDALDLTFVQSARFPHQYAATRDGVEFHFHINRDDPTGNPPQVPSSEVPDRV